MRSLFRSRLARDLDQYVVFKRSLGYTYESGIRSLVGFDRYVAKHDRRHQPFKLEHLLRGWLARLGKRMAVTVALELGIVRQFLRFRRRSDPGGFVPGSDWRPGPAVSHFVPHIFTVPEVRSLLRAARVFGRARIRAKTFRALILMLYCTGLRPGEAGRLRDDDVDLKQRVIVVRQSKGKTRFVPFRADLSRELERYRRARRAAEPGAETFFIRSDGQPLSESAMRVGLRAIFERAGLRRSSTGALPRPFDFRHTFAVQRLTRWYRTGADLHAKLPWLSAYLGHVDLFSTETYLTSTPELLATASRRFAVRVHRRVGGDG
jgi:integrase